MTITEPLHCQDEVGGINKLKEFKKNFCALSLAKADVMTMEWVGFIF